MLGTYQQAIFAVPENPVMRAVVNVPLLMTPTQQKGVTGFGRLGCAGGCQSKISPFGLGYVNDFGLRLYGDFYGSQQHGGMRLNGDPLPLGSSPYSGLGTYFPSDAHGYRGFSGLGDLETMLSNFTSGNFGAALTGNDIASSVPNWLVIGAAVWFFSTITGQASSVSKRVKRYTRRKAAIA